MSSFEGFKSRMAELGYKEGWNVRYSYYDAKGSDSVLNKFSRNIVEEKVDLIVTSSTTATVAAARATKGSNIPVLFLSAGNPEKFIKSFSSSGSNLAGISSATVEITGKKFELIRDIAPWVKRIATLQDPNGVNFEANLRESRNAAKILGFTLREFATGSREEIVNILPTITRQSADAIFTPPDSLITQLIDMIINQAIREKLPLITSLLANVKKGCLATYAADYSALGGQGAVLADKIFRGTKPADLPVELPKKWKLVLNMKTARAIGLNIPKEVLLRADEVFE
ncbi:MAG: ABC transporter substrate-binding protein [Deltaproteobacteria bacterium]|nr:ABC transporter substrate-binding protein [Deltaproteobacteria bacterium]